MDDSSATVQSLQKDLSSWEEENWKVNKISFHKPEVNQVLLEYSKELLGGVKQKVLVPLCGKTLDMKWLYDEGHTVIGVEGVEMAVLAFFEENKLCYNVKETDGKTFKIYMTEDERLKILLGDFLNVTSEDCEGPVDAIWDRGSLVAISPSSRPRYAEVIKNVLGSGGKILLEVFEYDPHKFSGPPHHVPKYHVHELYDSSCKVDLLSSTDYSKMEIAARCGLSQLFVSDYLLTKK